jgi:putative drug exporter of the RND superfamily
MNVFQAIGKFSVKFRWFILIAWIIAVPVAVKTLPSLASVTNTNNVKFLPSSSASQQATTLLTPFQGKAASTATIVASTASGQLTAADNQAITQVEQSVKSVSHVITVRDQGTSKDGQVREALVGFDIASTSPDAQNVVDQVRAKFDQLLPSVTGVTAHLTNGLASSVDANNQNNKNKGNTQKYSLILIIVLLFIVYRSLLAPFVTLMPVILTLILSGPVIAEITKRGWIQVSPITQLLMIVLILGAGTDYGLFLVFRVREELRRGLQPKEAVVRAVSRVGESITFSAATVITALLCLLLASFGLYHGLGPALAVSIAIMLLAGLTLLPALLTIFGKATFWPFTVKTGQPTIGMWGKLADRVIQRPVVMLLVGVVIFGALASGIIGYKVGGFTTGTIAPATSDSVQGANVISAHFPKASSGSESLLLTFKEPVWSEPNMLSKAQQELSSASVFQAVNGPLTTLTLAQLTDLHRELGAAATLSPVPAAGSKVSPALYQAYRATSAFISPDGRTVQFVATLRAGAGGSQPAINAIPKVRSTVAQVASSVGASSNGVAGQDAASYDIGRTSTNDLKRIVPVVLVIIAVLLAILLRSLIAPWYLILTVGLSYLASLGFAMIVFVHFGNQPSISFLLPFMMFVFTMALGEDYNILVMSRIREEAHGNISLKEAVTNAIGFTGGTITSAGLILAGTFAALGVAGQGNPQVQQVGFSIAFGILLDTFFVRTLFVPSIAVLLDRWNWWPSKLWRDSGETSFLREGVKET